VDPEFVKQVTHLKEFNESEKHIDSIAAKQHMPFKIGLVIIANFSSIGNKENHGTDHLLPILTLTEPMIISFC
jgi:hypothetical protein